MPKPNVADGPRGPAEAVVCLVVALSRWSGYTAVAGMLLLIVADVFSRWFLDRSVLVAGEMSGYALVALIFLGLAYSDAKDRTIVITMFTELLPPRVRQVLSLINLVAATLFVAWLAWFTWQPVRQDMQIGTVSLAGSNMPVWIPEVLMPLGLLLLAIQLARRTLAVFAGGGAKWTR